jgi:hypothetical protein
MREEIADLVHPVLSYGLLLQERLKRGEAPDFDTEQAVLKGRLGTDLEARRIPEYGGDAAGLDGVGGLPQAAGGERFLGIRYALACWLDEIFILDSPWSRAWAEKQFESAVRQQRPGVPVLGSKPGWRRCARQPRRAGSVLPVRDARLSRRDGRQTGRLQGWVQAENALNRSPRELSLPPEQEVRPDVPPRLRSRNAAAHGHGVGGGAALLVPVIVFIVAWTVLHR